MKARNRKRFSAALSSALTLLFAVAFLTMAFLALIISLQFFAKFLLAAAIPFLLVSLLRFLIRAERPATAGKRAKEKNSFPSRHSYSGFFIATVSFLFFRPSISYALLAFAVLLATARVLSGKHYPRDVVAGAFLGVIFGTVTLLLF